MLVTRGLGRDGSAGGPLVTGGLGRYTVTINDGDIRATLAGTSSLSVSAQALANIQATLDGYGSITAYLEDNPATGNSYVQFGGQWYVILDVYVRSGGSWVQTTELHAKKAGNWVKVWG